MHENNQHQTKNMKITHFHAERVHKYLNITIDFDKKLNFLYGPNGCGKTTSLKIIMAILTPSIEDLLTLDFVKAEVKLENNEKEITITVLKESTLKITITRDEHETQTYTLNNHNLFRETQDIRKRHYLLRKYKEIGEEESVFSTIQNLSTPMFLGLDRRFENTDNSDEINRSGRHHINTPNNIDDILELFRTKTSEIRITQEGMNSELARKMLINSLTLQEENKEISSNKTIHTLKTNLKKLKSEDTIIRKIFKEDNDNIEAMINSLITATEKSITLIESQSKKQSTLEDVASKVSFFLNMDLIKKTLKNIELLSDYEKEYTKLRSAIDNFIIIMNKFLYLSNKKIEISPSDKLIIKTMHTEIEDLNLLSSGERQLLTMLGHLTLNKRLDSGVFIVDEPELSLNIGWQEMFVEALQEANQNVQLIFATHSPSIIMDKTQFCREVKSK